MYLIQVVQPLVMKEGQEAVAQVMVVKMLAHLV